MTNLIPRRDFITLLGGATVTWPLMAHAQQPSMPVIGLLHVGGADLWTLPLARFRRVLNDAGYVEGRNIAIEFHWAEGRFEQLPALAADLVRRRVSVIFASGPPAVVAAKAQTTTIPIVFFVGEDPVKEGLVASLNRPGGNVTGVTNFQNQLFGKQLGLLREIAPQSKVFAFLVNPDNPNAEPDTKDARAAADVLRLDLRVLTARSADEVELAFATMSEQRVGGLLVGVSDIFSREQLPALAARHAIPAIFYRREFTNVGGLMSYGANTVESWRLCGDYVVRVLKGEKPADLPVQQATSRPRH